MKLKLYIDALWMSPYTYSVHTALVEKGLDFELREIEFAQGEVLTPAFQGKTYTDLIPALEHGSLVLSESIAVLEYLDELQRTPPLFPENREDRARARMLLSWYRCGFQALRNERSTETIFFPERRVGLAPLTQEAAVEIGELKLALKDWLKPGQSFIFGNSWSIADAETALMLQRVLASGGQLEEHLAAYARSQWERPSVKRFVTHARGAFRSYY